MKRNELLILVEKNGLNDSKVLKCSQELDLLIYQIQLIHREKTRIDYFLLKGMGNE
ncbi:aspartyl-phosphate phosphatase Spo0E family protein [Bacillus sp. EB106-08-02-XG196]|uniref:aspartyl-phosphate phosphatase Spo0E family protein n=1 Tax=Bacillus sp. EB106-08-02-XG196 TaxID=2737049 RepID=UPI00211AF614|nr:aspartyl-phosphate phosphatase Spo0E family protein [Bacillus sp. EB106-08-02-XG196]